MTRPIITSLILAFSISALARAETATILGKDAKWEKIHARTVSELKDLEDIPTAKLSRFGGLAEKKTKPTGFFYTKKISDRWWLVDPNGCLFITVGLCSINHGAVDSSKMPAKFGTETNWAVQTAQMLKEYGFNTLGCWSDWRTFRPTPQRMPYTPRWNFMASYKNRRPAKHGKRGFPNLTMPIFDPEFEDFCDSHARQLAETKDDPWLLGHFSDNELPFRPDALTNYLALDESDTGRKAAEKWWLARSQKLGKTKIEAEDQAAFTEFLARKYYSIVSKAIKKYDPNHLYLGSRIHGRTIKPPVFKGAKGFIDVMSVNYYHRWTAEQDRLSAWVENSGVPFIVSEWYAQSLETPDAKVSGAGFRVKTDTDRGLYYQNLTFGLIENAGCVGWHWFKYGGDGPAFHKGIVSRNYTPHTKTLNLMAQLNKRAYQLIEYFDRKQSISSSAKPRISNPKTKKDSTKMTDQITHSVFFTLNHPENSPEEAAFLEDSFRILSTIPGVDQFKVLKETSPKNPYRFGFTMKFKNQPAYDAYSAHPDHNKYVEERWLKEVADFQEIDHKTIRP